MVSRVMRVFIKSTPILEGHVDKVHRPPFTFWKGLLHPSVARLTTYQEALYLPVLLKKLKYFLYSKINKKLQQRLTYLQ